MISAVPRSSSQEPHGDPRGPGWVLTQTRSMNTSLLTQDHHGLVPRFPRLAATSRSTAPTRQADRDAGRWWLWARGPAPERTANSEGVEEVAEPRQPDAMPCGHYNRPRNADQSYEALGRILQGIVPGNAGTVVLPPGGGAAQRSARAISGVTLACGAVG